MKPDFVNIGLGNLVATERIIAIIDPYSAPVKRLIKDARTDNKLIDATYGRKKRAVIITDSDHIIVTSLQPETIANRCDLGGK